MRKSVFISILSCFAQATMAQGCSDAGVCTIGDFYAKRIEDAKKAVRKNEIDLSFNYGAHGSQERFYQPQINFRHIKKNGSFFEIRLPLSIARMTEFDGPNSLTNTGIGDITATYNNKFSLDKDHPVKYSVGLRISFSNADKSSGQTIYSYPMSLQNGLGTTDILAAASYDLGKYVSVGTGIQVPVIQYNKHVAKFVPAPFTVVNGEGFRRKPDALLKLMGHYQWKQIKLNAGALGIFHLGEDHYNSSSGKYVLEGSSGTTLNLTAELICALSKQWTVGILYAEPFKTRKIIPDGLARSRIVSAKLTFGF